MSDLKVKISALTQGTPLDTDIIPYVDLATNTTKKALKSELKGDKGDNATVDVGTTTTGNPGTDASVVNVGTTSDAIFNFTIPRGNPGADSTVPGPAGNGIQSVELISTVGLVKTYRFTFTDTTTFDYTTTDGSDGNDGLDITWLGAYNAGTTYVINDAISYNGSSYICILESTGNLPTNTTYFDLMAQKGDDGFGSGDVMGPATNTDSYIPQWDGVNSKTLKNGIPTSTFAPALGDDDNYVTNAELTKLQSGVQAIETTTSEYQRNIICRARTTANITLSGTMTVDGVALIAGNYILVANQTTASQNGVYQVNAGAWTRAIEYDETIELDKHDIFIVEGTTYKKTWWVCATKNATVGTTSLSFAQIPNGIGTASDQASAGNHSHTALNFTGLASMGASIAKRYTSRTATASTGTTDNIVRFNGSTAGQIETMPDGVAVVNNSGRIISFINDATVNWTIRQFTSNTLDGSASDFILRPGYFKVVMNIAVDTWITIGYGRKNDTFDLEVPTEAYDATNWNGSLEVPTKDAIRDKFESLSLSGSNLQISGLTAGENMSANDFFKAGLSTTITTTATSNGVAQFGYDTSSNYERGQSFTTTATGYLKRIDIMLYKNGTPNLVYNLEVFSNTGTTLLETSSNNITINNLTTSAQLVSFDFSSTVELSASTVYYCKLNYVSGTISTSNYGLIQRNTTNPYAGGAGYNINNSNTWTVEGTTDYLFSIITVSNTTKKYKSNSINSENSKIEGIVTQTVTADETFTGNIGGLQGGFTGLIPGEVYYLKDDGTIGTTAGTTSVKVGKAISATQINFVPPL